jgi:hypothetical protein
MWNSYTLKILLCYISLSWLLSKFRKVHDNNNSSFFAILNCTLYCTVKVIPVHFYYLRFSNLLFAIGFNLFVFSILRIIGLSDEGGLRDEELDDIGGGVLETVTLEFVKR